jgi:hypothetical protein
VLNPTFWCRSACNGHPAFEENQPFSGQIVRTSHFGSTPKWGASFSHDECRRFDPVSTHQLCGNRRPLRAQRILRDTSLFPSVRLCQHQTSGRKDDL